MGARGLADADRVSGGRRRVARLRFGLVSPRELTIDGVRIADDTDCWVIAEIGHNHQGSLEQCKELFAEAARCGANAVKLQKRDNRALYTREVFNRPYENENSYGPTYGLHREALEFGRAEYQELKAYAAELGVTFFATAFDFKSAEMLAELDMPAYKIASGDLTNTPLLTLRRRARQADDRLHRRRHARRRPPRATTASPRSTRSSRLLQCTAGYPVENWEELDLRVIETYRELFDGRGRRLLRATTTGSRCRSPRTCSAAGSSRSTSRSTARSKGTDHRFSLEPVGLRKLVRDLQRTRLALGDGRQDRRTRARPTRSRRWARRSSPRARSRPGHVARAATTSR